MFLPMANAIWQGGVQAGDALVVAEGMRLQTGWEAAFRNQSRALCHAMSQVNSQHFDGCSASRSSSHENWTIPRMQGYARLLGVDFVVSPWQDDGTITVRVKDYTPPKEVAKSVSQ